MMESGSQKLGEVVSRQADLIVALKKEQSANKYQSTCTEKLRKVVAIRFSDAADVTSQLRKVLISTI